MLLYTIDKSVFLTLFMFFSVHLDNCLTSQSQWNEDDREFAAKWK